MFIRKHHVVFTIILVIVLSVNLLSVRSARADGETPTEPAAATEAATEPPTADPIDPLTEPPTIPSAESPTQPAAEPPTEVPTESTPEPVLSTPQPLEVTATPLAEAISEAPENVEVVVLDENGEAVPLASQDAAEIAAVADPMWCPEGVLPGGPGCSISYTTISDLINNMVSNTGFYSQNGIIYFTADPGTGTLNLSETTLTADFDTLKNYNLTLQGGWNGDTVSPTFSGQTDFTNHPITIGSSANPWVGNITLNSITFTGASQTSLTVYTTTGSITLNDIDVNNQGGGNNTAWLSTAAGNISVSNGIFDGNGTNSAGFSASTLSGSITISDASFTENKKSGPTNNSNGALLSAPVITLANVIASNNDGNGITIVGANLVTLNSVVATNNGTDPAGAVPNYGSGLFITGAPGLNVFVNLGTFSDNKRYGIELENPAGTTMFVQSPAVDCTGNVSGCSNGTFVDATPPTLNLPADIVTPATGPGGTVVTFFPTATDNVDPTVAVSCLPASGSMFDNGTTVVNCSATDTAGNIALGSFLVTVQDTPVVITPTPPTPTAPPPGTPTSEPPTSEPPTSEPPTSDSSEVSSNAPALIIPVTGGKAIDLDCNSAFWAFGIKLSFTNLCDYQTILENVSLNDLPEALPSDYSFVMGLDLSILSENQAVESLPAGSSVQMDFPLMDGARDEFAVLHWNGSAWVEVSPQSSDDQNFYRALTTDQTGIFVLVKK